MSESLEVRPEHQYLKISRGKQVNGRLVGDGLHSEEKTAHSRGIVGIVGQ